MRVPNVLLWLLQALAWVYWRSPMATQTKPKREPRPPRRPTLCYTVGNVPDEIHSIVRTSWFRKGKPVEVDEIQIFECGDSTRIFHYVVGQALRQGADVSVLTTYPAHILGVPED
jgi:hypothetical protein